MEPWKDLAEGVAATIEGRAGKFLDDNAAAKDFILERSKRLAKLVWEYKTAGTDAERHERKTRMELVQSTIEMELAAVALNGSTEAKETFKAIVETAFGVLVKAAPSILALI